MKIGDRTIGLLDLNPVDLALGSDLKNHQRNAILHALWRPAQHDISRLLWLNIWRDAELVELLPQFRLAEKKPQWRADIVKLVDWLLARLLFARNIEPCDLAVAKKQLLARLLIFPAHLARLLQPERAGLRP